MTMIEKQEKFFGLLRQARYRNSVAVILFRRTFTPAQRILVWLSLVFIPLLAVVAFSLGYHWIGLLTWIASLCAVYLIPRHILLRHDVTGSKTTKWPSKDDRLYSIFSSLLDEEPDVIEDLLPLQEWLEASQLAKPKVLIYSIFCIAAYWFLPFYDAFVKESVGFSYKIAFAIVAFFVGISIAVYNLLDLRIDRRRIARAELHRLVSMYIAEKKHT